MEQQLHDAGKVIKEKKKTKKEIAAEKAQNLKVRKTKDEPKAKQEDKGVASRCLG